jgi:hypothetical protein
VDRAAEILGVGLLTADQARRIAFLTQISSMLGQAVEHDNDTAVPLCIGEAEKLRDVLKVALLAADLMIEEVSAGVAPEPCILPPEGEPDTPAVDEPTGEFVPPPPLDPAPDLEPVAVPTDGPLTEADLEAAHAEAFGQADPQPASEAPSVPHDAAPPTEAVDSPPQGGEPSEAPAEPAGEPAAEGVDVTDTEPKRSRRKANG